MRSYYVCAQTCFLYNAIDNKQRRIDTHNSRVTIQSVLSRNVEKLTNIDWNQISIPVAIFKTI